MPTSSLRAAPAMRWLSLPAASAEASRPSCRSGRTILPDSIQAIAEGEQQRDEREQQAPAQAPTHGGEGDVGRQADRDQPRHLLGGRRAGDALDAVRPAHDFADFAGGEVPGDVGAAAEIAADPVRAVDALRDRRCRRSLTTRTTLPRRQLRNRRALPGIARASVPTASTARRLALFVLRPGGRCVTTHSLPTRERDDVADRSAVPPGLSWK